MSFARTLTLALVAGIAGLLLAFVERSPASVETVLQDDAALLHGTPETVREDLARIRELGVHRVRLTAGWGVIAPYPDQETPPEFDAEDPAAYPPGAWDNLDRAVKLAHEAGLSVNIDIAFWAPRWAVASADDPRPRTGIDLAAYARFARAVARRYSGAYVTPEAATAAEAQRAGSRDDALRDLGRAFGSRSETPEQPAGDPAPEPLPRVSMFTVWNEPNHPGFLMPQWEREEGRWVVRSADIYRRMLHAAVPVIRAEQPDATILVGATSSFGSKRPGIGASSPLAFLRRLACVDAKLRPIRTGGCADFQPIPGDGWSHHPYSLRTVPEQLPVNRDDAPVAATGRLVTLLDRLAGKGRLAPALRDVYMTEYGYETNPPDPRALFGLHEQGELLARAESIATRSPRVKMWAQFLLTDRPGDPAGPQMRPFGDWQSGLFDVHRRPKPAAAVYRAPVVARCVSRAGRRTWVEIRAGLRSGRGGEQPVVDVFAAKGGAGATARAAVLRPRPKLSAQPRAVAAVARHDGKIRRLGYARTAAGDRVRVTWRGAVNGAHSATVKPLACPKKGRSPMAKRSTKAANHVRAAGASHRSLRGLSPAGGGSRQVSGQSRMWP